MTRKPKKEPWQVGHASQERMQHAKTERLVLEQERFEDGRPTGLKRKRFKDPIEQLCEKGAISKLSFEALARFQADYERVKISGARMIGNYEGGGGGGTVQLQAQERQVRWQQEVARALRSVSRELHPVLGWVASCAEVPHAEISKLFWPDLGQRSRSPRFFGLVEMVGQTLADVYGLKKGPKSKLCNSRSSILGDFDKILGFA